MIQRFGDYRPKLAGWERRPVAPAAASLRLEVDDGVFPSSGVVGTV
jgi:hypothetical protein